MLRGPRRQRAFSLGRRRWFCRGQRRKRRFWHCIWIGRRDILGIGFQPAEGPLLLMARVWGWNALWGQNPLQDSASLLVRVLHCREREENPRKMGEKYENPRNGRQWVIREERDRREWKKQRCRNIAVRAFRFWNGCGSLRPLHSWQFPCGLLNGSGSPVWT